MTEALTAFLEATVRTATPLAFAALGETVSERAGVINVGLEGVIIAGCFGALVGAQGGSVEMGLLGGVLGGAASAGVFALFVTWLRADQIITGTALTLGALGLTGTLYRSLFGTTGAALTIPTLRPIAIPVLSDLPLFGAAFFRQPVVTYLLYLLVGLVWWFLTRTHAGLALRAVGEQPEAAEAAGIRPARLQAAAVLVSGVLGGMAGASLVLAQVGTFTEGMSAGRGFIAIAIVALGRWRPLGVALAALLFGGATALQYLLQSMGTDLPYQLFLAFPYILTLVVLAAGSARVRAPAALGRRNITGH
ncbi:MAG: ABC transporter permease [Gemmatimonadetes bacterium]|nr:ABC transporter permease [Gemmatimonadota bacterium]MCC6769671.1 ABC transporter permease [Gemmatimonadaceae bacterium]